MIKVSEYYANLEKEEGKELAAEFLEQMKKWDGGNDVSQAFYTESLLYYIVKDARESLEQKKHQNGHNHSSNTC